MGGGLRKIQQLNKWVGVGVGEEGQLFGTQEYFFCRLYFSGPGSRQRKNKTKLL